MGSDCFDYRSLIKYAYQSCLEEKLPTLEIWKGTCLDCKLLLTFVLSSLFIDESISRVLAGGFPHQSSPFYMILHIYLIQPTLSYTSPYDSMSPLVLLYPLNCSTFYSMFLFTQPPSSFHNTYPCHLK